MFLLDANTISGVLKQASPGLQRHFQRVQSTELFVSSLVEAELRYGIAKRGLQGSRLGNAVDTFLANVIILPWTSSTATHFAQLRTDSEATGVTIDTVDLMIATHAKEQTLTLVTHDEALHQLKPWIKVADWIKR
jgi:tRNA(fMet)-specific endonuclease VapC